MIWSSLKLQKVSPIFWILFLGILLRFALALVLIDSPERAIHPDTGSYFTVSYAILTGDGWNYPTAVRTPIYPLFLASGMAVFGENIFALVLLQIFVGTVNIYFVYKIAQRFFTTKIALVSAFLLAVSIESVTHSIYLLTETLFVLLFLLSTYCFAIYFKSGRKQLLFLSGVLLGVAILTRPFIMYYPLFLIVIILFRSDTFIIRVKEVSLFSLACLMIVTPWVVRNHFVVGIPTVSTISSHNLYFYNALSYDASKRNIREDLLLMEYENLLMQNIHDSGLPDTEANRARVASALAKNIIFSNPVDYSLNHLKHNANSLLPDTSLLELLGLSYGQKGTLAVLKHSGIFAAINHYFEDDGWMILLLVPSILVLLVSYLGWGIATVQLFWKRHFFPLVFLSLPILYGLMLPGSPSTPRFRVPVMPFLCILAALGLYCLITYYNKTKRNHEGIPSTL